MLDPRLRKKRNHELRDQSEIDQSFELSRLARIFEEQQYDVPAYSSKDILLFHQRQWIADDSPVKWGVKGRRTGLTWAEGADAVLRTAASKSAGGMDYFYVGSDKDMAREFIDACGDWAQAFTKAIKWRDEGVEIDKDGDFFEDKDGNKILKFTITFESGFKIHALSSNPKNFRGRQGNVCIDEGAFHDEFQEVLKAAMALLMWGGRVRIISSYNGVDNLFYEMVEAIKQGKREDSLHFIPLSYALACGLYQRICEVTNQEWSLEAEEQWFDELYAASPTVEDADEEYEAIPKASAGAYIARHLLDRAGRPQHRVIRYTAPDDFMSLSEDERVRTVNDWLEHELKPYFTLLSKKERHSLGEDFARKGDLTVLTLTAIRSDTSRPQVLVIELRNMPYNQQRQSLFWVGHRMPRLTGMALDATGNGGYLAEQAQIEFGTNMVESVHLSNKYYDEWMPKYKAGFEDGTIEIPLDEEIIQDHRAIQVINGVPKIEKGSTKSARGGQRHGDSAVSGMLSYRASFMDEGIIEFIEVTEHSNDYDPFDDDSNYNDFSRGAY